MTPNSPRPANRLSKEKSPYLLQHAHNPVDWYPWGPEALEAARTSDKPIFLSVGYSACHWCHVMERESFENEEIARLINEQFIPVKVDREERPDIDEIYMTAVQMMTGHGGWPMSVFLTPDGRPFFAGTYFPPEDRHGRIGFRSLVRQLAEAYRKRRDEIEEVANSIVEDLRKATRQRPLSSTGGPVNLNTQVEHTLDDLKQRFDEAHGGFGGAPKFPPHHALRFLVTAAQQNQPDALRMLSVTLDKMALGGIYDHIGGGFHRYSTDAVWLLPHFEKMLYDNALLVRIYADASLLTGNEAYARIARETCDWVLREMVDPAGGFHAALDADSEGEEGKYYVWTPEEVAAVLGPAAEGFCEVYHIVPGGNFREEATGHATGASIPFLAVADSEAHLSAHLPEEIQQGRAALLSHRNRRVPPGKDDKVITAWNGLMIGALAFAGKTLKEPRYIEAAARAADFCLTTLRPGGHLLRRYARGEAGLPAFLDDYAYLIEGLLDLYDATRNRRWIEVASALADVLLEKFWDEEDTGFFFVGKDQEQLIARSKDLFDGALPSANGIAAWGLVRLAKETEVSRYQEAARTLLLAYRGVIQRAPGGTYSLLLALMQTFAQEEETRFSLVTVRSGDASVVAPGASTTVVFYLTVAEGFHVNGRHAGAGSSAPTVAEFATDLPAAVGPVRYPEPVLRESGGDTLPVYEGTAPFIVPIAVAKDALPGEYALTLRIRCQPCSDRACLPEEEVVATARVSVG